MTVLKRKDVPGHEEVVFVEDEATGLRGIIAIHNTRLGPSLGGCRMWRYENEDDALQDVLRLSKGMTYKAAVADLPLGGGKSVIIGDAFADKTPALMQAMGKAVEDLGGRYIVAEDVGMSEQDMVEMSKQTTHVVGLPVAQGHAGGDPSPYTAYGVFLGLKTSVKYRLGKENLGGLKVAVQGLGNVGYNVCKRLHDDGAQLFVTDVNDERCARAQREFGAHVVPLNDIYDVKTDVYAPCALGATLNDQTLARLHCSVIAGAANNQLAEERHGKVLQDKDVLYAPDYVINAGGLINVAYENPEIIAGENTKSAVLKHIERIPSILEDIYQRAEKESIPNNIAADRIAEDRFMN